MSHDIHRERAKKWAMIQAKAWKDKTFKAKLLAHPNQVLKENGIEVKPGVHIKVVENTKSDKYLILPSPEELSETEMNRLNAGVDVSCTFDCSSG
jgi:hypothetical protein